MIPKQQTGQRIFSRPPDGEAGGGVWSGPLLLRNKTFFGLSHGTGVESGLIFRAFALVGSIFTGASRSIVFRIRWDRVARFFFPPRLVGKTVPTREALAYTITYCIFPYFCGLRR